MEEIVNTALLAIPMTQELPPNKQHTRLKNHQLLRGITLWTITYT